MNTNKINNFPSSLVSSRVPRLKWDKSTLLILVECIFASPSAHICDPSTCARGQFVTASRTFSQDFWMASCRKIDGPGPGNGSLQRDPAWEITLKITVLLYGNSYFYSYENVYMVGVEISFGLRDLRSWNWKAISEQHSLPYLKVIYVIKQKSLHYFKRLYV